MLQKDSDNIHMFIVFILIQNGKYSACFSCQSCLFFVLLHNVFRDPKINNYKTI